MNTEEAPKNEDHRVGDTGTVTENVTAVAVTSPGASFGPLYAQRTELFWLALNGGSA